MSRVYLDDVVLDAIHDVAWLAKPRRNDGRDPLRQVNVTPGFIWSTDSYRLAAVIDDDGTPDETVSFPWPSLADLPSDDGVWVETKESEVPWYGRATRTALLTSWRCAGQRFEVTAHRAPDLVPLVTMPVAASVVIADAREYRAVVRDRAAANPGQGGGLPLICVEVNRSQRFVLNAKFLMDGLRWMGANPFRISVPESNVKPIVLTSADRLYLLMPIRAEGCTAPTLRPGEVRRYPLATTGIAA